MEVDRELVPAFVTIVTVVALAFADATRVALERAAENVIRGSYLAAIWSAFVALVLSGAIVVLIQTAADMLGDDE